ncbi:ABC transporter ATP-binding protein [Agromyces endophyticus]|uniref:ABC transporter ATP-binding protein n=1 Tax=Agromyces sp. H17E-10 TaxID=2932244 RepID=UPI001FD128F2|nr:ABC transporter ATP-binding protein [Agromyces sp. H17E-10]UOQ89188.1 ABC transporter ATP-binding protein [Agromyces sp. H17E-10]
MSLLTIEDLRVSLPVGKERRVVLRGIDLELDAGQSLAIVGESGSGKSMTARAIARLLPRGAKVDGSIRFDGQEVLTLKDAALRRYQSTQMAVIFQDPRVHLNPVRTIGDFLTEGLVKTRGFTKRAAERKVISLLDEVGIPDGERRLRQYPHELSGGLLQRVMIASALACEPRILLADEPTTALDVSTQSDVMAIIDELCKERGMALVFITHDLELASAICDRTAVMYAGQVIEIRGSDELVNAPRHPYSAGLLGAKPEIASTVSRLQAIPGRPRAAFEVHRGCAFADRCAFVEPECLNTDPPLEIDRSGAVRCLLADELQLNPMEGVLR